MLPYSDLNIYSNYLFDVAGFYIINNNFKFYIKFYIKFIYLFYRWKIGRYNQYDQTKFYNIYFLGIDRIMNMVFNRYNNIDKVNGLNKFENILTILFTII